MYAGLSVPIPTWPEVPFMKNGDFVIPASLTDIIISLLGLVLFISKWLMFVNFIEPVSPVTFVSSINASPALAVSIFIEAVSGVAVCGPICKLFPGESLFIPTSPGLTSNVG